MVTRVKWSAAELVRHRGSDVATSATGRRARGDDYKVGITSPSRSANPGSEAAK
ncbi:MAG: hypothetical protein RLZZ426_679 [Actinomycetota bacterium]